MFIWINEMFDVVHFLPCCPNPSQWVLWLESQVLCVCNQREKLITLVRQSSQLPQPPEMPHCLHQCFFLCSLRAECVWSYCSFWSSLNDDISLESLCKCTQGSLKMCKVSAQVWAFLRSKLLAFCIFIFVQWENFLWIWYPFLEILPQENRIWKTHF